jgi:hypothetical protein
MMGQSTVVWNSSVVLENINRALITGKPEVIHLAVKTGYPEIWLNPDMS